MQAQPQIVTRGQHRVHPRRKVRQQPAELSECLRRIQLVQIINNQREAGAGLGEFRQHPVSHRRCVEVRRGCRRSCAAGRGRSVTDRVEQGQPELLGVLLIALHLQHGEPVALTLTAGPGAQQRCLPAAGRSRDDRHLPCRGAIHGGEKIAPVNQPASCLSHRQRPALISTPDALASVTQSRHLSSRYQASARAVNGREPPVLHYPGLANHQDPVTTDHLPGGKPGSVPKARTTRLRRSA